MPTYVPYRDDIETLEPDEPETFQKIIDTMLQGQHNVRAKYGESVRVSHAKAHGFLKGELVVEAGLPPELTQGLFAQPGAHPVLVRLAQIPGDVSDDRVVSTPRGMSIKVLNATGPKLPGHAADTQDFLLDTGKAFIVGGAKAFLAAFQPNAHIAPKLPEAVKGVASKVSQATNAVLQRVRHELGQARLLRTPPVPPAGRGVLLPGAPPLRRTTSPSWPSCRPTRTCKPCSRRRSNWPTRTASARRWSTTSALTGRRTTSASSSAPTWRRCPSRTPRSSGPRT